MFGLAEWLEDGGEPNELDEYLVQFVQNGENSRGDRLSIVGTASLLCCACCIALYCIAKVFFGSSLAGLLASIPSLWLAGGSHRLHTLCSLARVLWPSDFPAGATTCVLRVHRALGRATARTSLPGDLWPQAYEFWCSSRHEIVRGIAGRCFNAPVPSG